MPANKPEPCFACGKPMKNRKKAYRCRVIGETTVVFVGPDCYRRATVARDAGYQPPLGGPRLIALPD